MTRLRSRQAETQDVNARRLADDAVHTRHIKDWAVTADKLHPGIFLGRLGTQHLTSEAQSALAGVGEMLVGSGEVTIAAGGASLCTSLTSLDNQHGFAEVVSAGDAWLFPQPATYLAHVDVKYTDGYRGGGVVTLTVDGATVVTWQGETAVWARWIDSAELVGLEEQTFDVHVAPTDGLEHTAKVKVRLAVVEPLKAIVEPDAQLVVAAETLSMYRWDVRTESGEGTFIGNPYTDTGSGDITVIWDGVVLGVDDIIAVGDHFDGADVRAGVRWDGTSWSTWGPVVDRSVRRARETDAGLIWLALQAPFSDVGNPLHNACFLIVDPAAATVTDSKAALQPVWLDGNGDWSADFTKWYVAGASGEIRVQGVETGTDALFATWDNSAPSNEVVRIRVDVNTGRVYVGTRLFVAVYDDAGTLLATVTFPDSVDVTAYGMDFSPDYTQLLWMRRGDTATGQVGPVHRLDLTSLTWTDGYDAPWLWTDSAKWADTKMSLFTRKL